MTASELAQIELEHWMSIPAAREGRIPWAEARRLQAKSLAAQRTFYGDQYMDDLYAAMVRCSAKNGGMWEEVKA